MNKMNQIFSPARFGAYAMRFVSQKSKNCLLMYVVVTGILACLMVLGGQSIDFFLTTAVLFIVAILEASRFSNNVEPRSMKIRFLLVPASQFEKMLASVLYLFIAVPLLYVVALFVAQYVAMFLVALFTLTPPQWAAPFHAVSINSDMLPWFCLSYYSSVSFYLMGATIWTRNTFLKTTVVNLLLGLVALIVISISAMAFTLQSDIISALGSISYTNDNIARLSQNVRYDMGSVFVTFGYIVSILFTLGYLVIAYLRIADFEVNETKR
ncbi:MAG TPA: hypothetical protein H9982_01410 [Candidatus Barnesiella excrementipullorum]|uniref:Uncharacterized protein n=1 Tax=Candidatus Barnesiella excrementipullorum TaxID=2838479 RepID=A0A9D1VQ12_9BACT|nr:hypothetical protein [Candidatus Barnesiella excrementipullorum]